MIKLIIILQYKNRKFTAKRMQIASTKSLGEDFFDPREGMFDLGV